MAKAGKKGQITHPAGKERSGGLLKGRLLATNHRREAQVVQILLRHLERVGPKSFKSALVVGDLSLQVAPALTGIYSAQWFLRMQGSHKAEVLPPAGPFERITFRIPPHKGVQDFCFTQLASRLAPEGELWVYGLNDEGVKSLGKRLKGVFDGVETLDTRNHGRLWRCVSPKAFDPTDLELAHWKGESDLGDLGTFIHYPGVFNKGRLDAATALLLDALGDLKAPQSLLDFGSGMGVIGRQAHALWPTAKLFALDSDPFAALASQENLPGATVYKSDGWGQYGGPRVDLILSNPPIHQGKGEDFTILKHLIEGAPRRLTATGQLIFVALSQLAVGPLMAAHFKTVQKIRETGRFTVWQGIRG